MEAGKALVMTSAVQTVGKERWKGRYPMTILKVIIPKGEMPESCMSSWKGSNECYLAFRGKCLLDDWIDTSTETRPANCPLEEKKDGD